MKEPLSVDSLVESSQTTSQTSLNLEDLSFSRSILYGSISPISMERVHRNLFVIACVVLLVRASEFEPSLEESFVCVCAPSDPTTTRRKAYSSPASDTYDR